MFRNNKKRILGVLARTWLSWMILSPCGSSLFLTHWMPCSCGSIMSGQRAQLHMMAPFSTESESLGSPSLPHRAISVSSVSRLSGRRPSVRGICRSTTSGVQLESTRTWGREHQKRGVFIQI